MTFFRAKTKDLVRRIIVSIVVSYLYYEQEVDLCREFYHLETIKVAIGIILNIQGRFVLQRMKACTSLKSCLPPRLEFDQARNMDACQEPLFAFPVSLVHQSC